MAALTWQSDREENRERLWEEYLERNDGNERLAQNALHQRFPSDLLPDELQGFFYAYCLTLDNQGNGNVIEWREIISTMDRLEVTIAFAMKRTAKYLTEEELTDE